MSKIVVGVDPDADHHGIAIYREGVLADLHMMRLMELQQWIKTNSEHDLLFSIENVCTTNSVHSNKRWANKRAFAEKGRCVGLVQQSQKELQRMLDHHGCKLVLQLPSKRWKDTSETAMFKKVTGWYGRSNPDTRSAAYFGFLAAGHNRPQLI